MSDAPQLLLPRWNLHVIKDLSPNGRRHLRRHDARQLIDLGEVVIELAHNLDRFFVLDDCIAALRFTGAQIERQHQGFGNAGDGDRHSGSLSSTGDIGIQKRLAACGSRAMAKKAKKEYTTSTKQRPLIGYK